MLQKKWKLEPLVPGYLVLVLKLIPVIHRCSIANIERVELDFFVTQQLYAMYRIVKQTEKSYLPSEFIYMSLPCQWNIFNEKEFYRFAPGTV